ncbi:hypothetical protein D7V86_08175 [bacterium D16-51]|nr:hypothetical protein D7V96_08160 [bacterium D16-59]RKI60575.1 hypothetical protein D7V86_08175 [bacterium D16-51]
MKIPNSYLIEVYLTSEKSQNKNLPFFWCILKCENGNYSNEGSGWAETPKMAYQEAYNYYETIIRPIDMTFINSM